MKKLILLVLSAALMLCVFAACSNDTPSDTATDTGAVNTGVPTDVIPVNDTEAGIVLPVDTLG